MVNGHQSRLTTVIEHFNPSQELNLWHFLILISHREFIYFQKKQALTHHKFGNLLSKNLGGNAPSYALFIFTSNRKYPSYALHCSIFKYSVT
jgi:hypothetical protein